MIPTILAAILTLAPDPLPRDTFTVDDRVFIGVAIPVYVEFINGDLNHDGVVNSADIIHLVRDVFKAIPLPTTGDTLFYQIPKNDTTNYLFIPTGGLSR